MSNSNFDKKGVDNSGTYSFNMLLLLYVHLLFWLGIFNDASFRNFAVKIFKFWYRKWYNPFSYCVMRWEADFYP